MPSHLNVGSHFPHLKICDNSGQKIPNVTMLTASLLYFIPGGEFRKNIQDLLNLFQLESILFRHLSLEHWIKVPVSIVDFHGEITFTFLGIG